MNCNKVSQLLSAFMDGELLGYEHRLIHHHLHQCSKCRVEYEELLQMKRLLSALRVHEPGTSFAATIVKRAAIEEAPASPNLGDWRVALPGFSGRQLAFSPFVGLGVGLTLVGMFFWVRPASPSNAGASRHSHIEFEPANVARDEPPQHIGELTNGLVREDAPHRAYFDPRYTEDLPNFPLGAHQPQQMRKSFTTTSYFR